MKAQEVLRRYAAGERSFCNANLRGANLRGKDLSGADFSGADIRSANFTNATLRGANFTKAQGGLQRRWMVMQLLLVTVIAGIAGVLQGFVGVIGSALLDGTTEGAVGFGIYVLLVMIVYAAIALQGFKIRAFGSIAVAFAVAVAGAVAGAFAAQSQFAVAVAVAVAVAFAVAVAVAVAGAGAVAVAGAVAGAVVVAGAGAVAVQSQSQSQAQSQAYCLAAILAGKSLRKTRSLTFSARSD